MGKCKANGCEVSSPSKLNSDGYCSKHRNKLVRSPNSPNANLDENAALIKRVEKLEAENKEMRAENQEMRAIMKQVLGAIDGIHVNMNLQRESINISTYKRDALNQYGRRESGRFINTKEAPLEYYENGQIKDTEDCVQLAIDAAAALDIKIERSDIQRAHRVGKRKKPTTDKKMGRVIIPKPRPVIVKFKDYGKRMSIMKKKKNFQEAVKDNEKLKDAFVVEDLTPLRNRLLWYAKNHCNGKFLKCHTKDGRILAQLEGSEKWISLNTPEEFSAHGIDVDLKVINKNLHCADLLETLEFPVYSELLQ